MLHLVDLLKGEHALADDAQRLVGVCVITDDLGSNHECGNEEVVPGEVSSSDEPGPDPRSWGL